MLAAYNGPRHLKQAIRPEKKEAAQGKGRLQSSRGGDVWRLAARG